MRLMLSLQKGIKYVADNFSYNKRLSDFRKIIGEYHAKNLKISLITTSYNSETTISDTLSSRFVSTHIQI